jgi:uncharacterized protein (TIGR02145 family)
VKNPTLVPVMNNSKKMKSRQAISNYISISSCVFLVFAISCDEEVSNTNEKTFTDPRDGCVYNTVTIGSKVWMVENLKYLPSVVGPGTGSEITPYYYVYDYFGTNVANAKATTNYSTYGVLYNWEAAKLACPEGWHLPSEEEWTELIDYVGGKDVAGAKLKEKGTTHWNSPNAGVTNESGFTALPGGRRRIDGTFLGIGDLNYLWSSTPSNDGWYPGAYLHVLSSIENKIHTSAYFKGVGYSVRCVKV